MSLRLFIGADPDDPRLFRQSGTDETADLFEREADEAGDKEQFILLLFKKYVKYYQQHFSFVSSYKFNASITIEGNYYEIEFNQLFLSQLTKLYFIYGWRVIKMLDIKFKKDGWMTSKPKGVVELYIYTKKTLAIAVRHSLINIEVKARKLAMEKLSFQLGEIESALNRYKFYSPTFERRYFIKQREIAEDLKQKLEKVLSIKKQIETIAQDNEEARSVNSIFNFLTFLYGGFPEPNSPNGPIPSNPLDIDNVSIGKLQKELLDNLLVLAKDHFLGLLLFTKLKKGFHIVDMQDELHSVIQKVKSDIIDITETLSSISPSANQSNSSRIETLVEWEKSDELDISNFMDSYHSIEDMVIEGFEDQKDFSLLSIDLLDALVQLNLVERDSFEYPVIYQYKSSLMDYLEKKEKEKESSDEFWEKVSKVSSFLTLTSVIPVVNEVTGPLAFILDLGLIFHTVSAINSQLGALERATKLDLISLKEGDVSYTNTMIRVGYLVNQAETIKQALFTQVAKEIVIQILGAKTEILLIKKAIAWRMYVVDIQNLFEERA